MLQVKLWVFPEGTRSMGDEMLPFKKGAFHLAVEGQLPILPIVYSSYRGFLNHPCKIFNPGIGRFFVCMYVEVKHLICLFSVS